MESMENDAPIQFLTPPVADTGEPNMLAAVLVLAAIGAFLVYVFIRSRAGSRSSDIASVEAGQRRASRPSKGKPLKASRPKPVKAPELKRGLLSNVSAKRSSDCRWRMDKRRNSVISTRWTCTSCGVEAYTQGNKPPRECKRALRPASI